jgi:CheY-like chemotaxis protein
MNTVRRLRIIPETPLTTTPDDCVTRREATQSASDEDSVRRAESCPILIVEDDADLREMMAQLLLLEGFTAQAVGNGREALEYLRRGDSPQLILLDLMMPVMDGWEFRREQQRDPKVADVPVIVLSALDQTRVGDIGEVAFLKKPLDFDRLLDLVRRFCQ